MGNVIFCDVGCADTSIIISEQETFIIDIKNEINKFRGRLPSTKKIKALFITHQHYDHFDGMKYLLDNNFSIDFLIHSPYIRRYQDNSVDYDEWATFESYVKAFEKKGSQIYKPYRQDSFDKPWWTTCGLKFWMIGPINHIANSDTRELHDACLVFKVDMGERHCIFTGDASDTSLNWIARNTNHYCDDILHASHHGSLNGANLDFIKGCSAKHTVISTNDCTYEGIPHPTALRRYQENTSKKVYRTDEEGELSATF